MSYRFSRRLSLLAVAAPAVVALAVCGAAQAQDNWPSNPITLIVPFPPGGPTDMVARVLAQQVGQQLGQSVIVDNRPGANGNIGNALVAKAPADGYTVLYNTSSIALSSSLYKKMSYDVTRDLRPVALTAVVPLGLVVNPKVPANTVQELVKYAQEHKGKLSYGSAGNGNVTHLAAFQVVQHYSLDASHVPYKGSAPADVDLVAGQIDFMTDTINSVAPFIKDGRLRLLAVSTAARIPNFPNAPTLAESGMTGFEAGAWQGVMVPAKTPVAVVERLNAELMKALKDPGVLEKLRVQGAEPLGSTPKAYGDYIQSEIKRWAGVVKSTGVSLD
ncbi:MULTISPECIES: Bug family tripartite tricarboxylate transporter substrate binding protein [Comamonas]|uniref:Bug family tripartite tricarboxylate transporter substrate binding protein n=1 Tax=Comamonas TaxID=283 RepID=UPI00050DBCA0|nr:MULTISPECIES: tripartite tricarboxylate transporter substrate binding protein [Comamonas]KGG94708.1 MFS transporter [Comamonas thiooxydans]KGH01388.1 MFS transporter [Comamonas thiooxydans]KGH07127.1 MFS transporter [Comamonas thiooxydans]KGH15166.1 MFS transporter [Comamonas thiooxydans]TZG07928.1 tripartite tricarboxylate transporter substrate binding protein [Comamonas thiooxydans]